MTPARPRLPSTLASLFTAFAIAAAIASTQMARADEPMPLTTPDEAAAAPAEPAEAAAAAAPALPSYFSATNDPAKPSWPDPTGAATGVWATPAGDGKGDVSVWRDTTGVWYRLNSSNNTFVAIGFGITGDDPVGRDYDGDGKTDLAVYRPSSGTWFVLTSSTNNMSWFSVTWGLPVRACLRKG